MAFIIGNNISNHLINSNISSNVVAINLTNPTVTNSIPGGLIFFLEVFYYLYLAYLGSLYPDIDHIGSHLGHRRKVLSYYIAMKFGHRTITHSLLGMLIGTLPVFLISQTTWIFFNFGKIAWFYFTIGYFSHLFTDTMNPKGIPWLYPKKTMYSLNHFQMGTSSEEWMNVGTGGFLLASSFLFPTPISYALFVYLLILVIK